MPSRSALTLMPPNFVLWRSARRIPIRPAAFWLWRRSDGASRTEAAQIGCVTLQIVRDWVVKFNAHGPDGLIDRKPPGRPSKLTDAHRAALVARVDAGPIPAVITDLLSAAPSRKRCREGSQGTQLQSR